VQGIHRGGKPTAPRSQPEAGLLRWRSLFSVNDIAQHRQGEPLVLVQGTQDIPRRFERACIAEGVGGLQYSIQHVELCTQRQQCSASSSVSTAGPVYRMAAAMAALVVYNGNSLWHGPSPSTVPWVRSGRTFTRPVRPPARAAFFIPARERRASPQELSAPRKWLILGPGHPHASPGLSVARSRVRGRHAYVQGGKP
jgi:hypothetical protein